MADIGDVEQALVAALGNILFGCYNAATTTNQLVRIYRGHPTNATLIKDRVSGTTDINVAAIASNSRNTTRWGHQVSYLPRPGDLGVVTVGNSATFSGSATAGDLAGVCFENQSFVYEASASDSAALIASALATAIQATTICWVTNSTLTVPGASSIIARTATAATSVEEWSRQEQSFQISIWAPTPDLRDVIASKVCTGLSQISFLTLADGTGGRLRYKATTNIDAEQAASLFRRDISYDVEYGTTAVTEIPTMLFGDLILNSTSILA